jgi:4-hydroxy-tetrahydrodipicolinate reductase
MRITKIALVGYGQMGKQIEELAGADEFLITHRFDSHSKLENRDYNFDVAIDFSTPNLALDNLQILAKLRKNVVMGTTGWYSELDLFKSIVNQSEIGFLWASNFSIGMQIFNRLIANASSLISNINEYDVYMHEFHHKRKMDSPSGTAITLAETILKNNHRKTKLETNRIDTRIDSETLHLSSTRGGEVVGRHSVFLDSPFDTIELTHEARNRKGFASGALLAAKWINGRSGFYSIEDMMKEIWK